MKFPMCRIYSTYILIHLLQPDFLRLLKRKQTKKPPRKKCIYWSPGQLPCWAAEYDSVITTWNNRNMAITVYTVTLTSAVCMVQEWVWLRGNGVKGSSGRRDTLVKERWNDGERKIEWKEDSEWIREISWACQSFPKALTGTDGGVRCNRMTSSKP